jgi:ring-1,2-phenylacetyl-CoA epoxidase subunit PaaD
VVAADTAYAVAGGVPDPELPVVTIAELGILRRVEPDGVRVVVTITPTYAGCPAMDTIRADLASALRRAGWDEVEIVTQLNPPWTTDWISEPGRAKLAAAGTAPPGAVARARRRALPVLPPPPVTCPHCGATDTSEVSRFGATACTSMWRCRTCAEPFAHLKAI